MLTMPALAIMALIALYPAIYALVISFKDLNLLDMRHGHWLGFSNYINLWHDAAFRSAVWKSVRWTLAIVIAQIAIAVPVALFLNLKFRGRGLLRSVVLLPYAMPATAVAITWTYMFDANFGVINTILKSLHFTNGYTGWLSDPTLSFLVLVTAMVWQGMPLMAIILLAALQAIPEEANEAAQIDGANAWQRYWHVTLPQLMPTIWLLLALRTIWMAQHVDTIFLLTNGGPAGANYTLPVYSFMLTTHEYRIGYASALAIVLSCILLAAATLYMRRMDRSRAYL